MSALTPVYSSTPSPLGRPGGPGLWNTRGLKLPDYIENIARGIMQGGEPDKSRAIATAIAAVRRWAAGGGKVTPEVRAAAAAALAEWEGLKASHAHANGGGMSIGLSVYQPPHVPAGSPNGGQFGTTSAAGTNSGGTAGKTPAQQHALHMAHVAHLQHLVATGKASPAQQAELAGLLKALNAPKGKASALPGGNAQLPALAAAARAAAKADAVKKPKAAAKPKAPAKPALTRPVVNRKAGTVTTMIGGKKVTMTLHQWHQLHAAHQAHVAHVNAVAAQARSARLANDDTATVIDLVGPKGYEHNWVFVGAPGVGAKVFHPQLGAGTVTAHDGSHATVKFGKGGTRSFEARPGDGGGRLAAREPEPPKAPSYVKDFKNPATAAVDTAMRAAVKDEDFAAAVRHLQAMDKLEAKAGNPADTGIRVKLAGSVRHLKLLQSHRQSEYKALPKERDKQADRIASTGSQVITGSGRYIRTTPEQAAQVKESLGAAATALRAGDHEGALAHLATAAEAAKGPQGSSVMTGGPDGRGADHRIAEHEQAVQALAGRARGLARYAPAPKTAKGTQAHANGDGAMTFLDLAVADAIAVDPAARRQVMPPAERVAPGVPEGGQYAPRPAQFGRHDTPERTAAVINGMGPVQRAAMRATVLAPPGFEWRPGDRLAGLSYSGHSAI